MPLKNVTKNQPIVKNVNVARDFWTRVRGLIGRDTLSDEETLFFERCSSIHTCFMRFPIDVVFINKEFKVQRTFENVKPWRLIMPVPGARSVFEFKSGVIRQKQISVGDQLNVEP
mgnify:CR=1 FL=1